MYAISVVPLLSTLSTHTPCTHAISQRIPLLQAAKEASPKGLGKVQWECDEEDGGAVNITSFFAGAGDKVPAYTHTYIRTASLLFCLLYIPCVCACVNVLLLGVSAMGFCVCGSHLHMRDPHRRSDRARHRLNRIPPPLSPILPCYHSYSYTRVM